MLSEVTAKNSPIEPCIHGSETEFAATASRPDNTIVDMGTLLEHNQKLSRVTFGKDSWLNQGAPFSAWWSLTPSGGRLYPDMSHLEVATPETFGIYDLVLQELVAEKIALMALNGYACSGDIISFQLNKRSGDQLGHFFGAHENISNKKRTFDRPMLANGIPLSIRALAVAHHLTRTLYTGEGGFGLEDEKLQYMLSPRVRYSVSDFSTRLNHPLVGSSDDLIHAKRRQVVGAANVSPWAIAVKHGMNGVLLNS